MKTMHAKPTVLIRACPRCRGDLFLNEEEDYVCLQCGRTTHKQAVWEIVQPNPIVHDEDAGPEQDAA
jgi:hypothetical protein